MGEVVTLSLPYLLETVGALYREMLGQRLRPFGLTLRQYRVIDALRRHPALNLRDLGAMTAIDVSTLSRLVTAQCKRGHLERTRQEGDGREVEITLTSAGHALAQGIAHVEADLQVKTTQAFTTVELLWLESSLAGIYDNLNSMAD